MRVRGKYTNQFNEFLTKAWGLSYSHPHQDMEHFHHSRKFLAFCSFQVKLHSIPTTSQKQLLFFSITID